MVFPRVNLPCHTAYSRPVISHYHKQVFSNKADVLILPHNLDMGESLPVGAYFVLALDDEYAAVSQDAVSFLAAVNIQFQHRFVIFASGSIAGAVVAIVVFVWPVARVRCPARRVHIGRVEDNAIYLAIFVGKSAAVGSIGNVGWAKSVLPLFDVLPEHPFAVGHVRYNATGWHIESEYFREYVLIRRLMCAENKVIFGDAIPDDPFGLRSQVHVLTAMARSMDRVGLLDPYSRPSW